MSVSKEEILESISSMSVMDLTDLIDMIEKKFRVSASAMPMAAPAAADAGAGDEAVEQSSFDVVLASIGDSKNKVPVIKVVRTATGLGLKEAKERVEDAPTAIKEGATKEEAEDLKKQLEDAGATVEVK